MLLLHHIADSANNQIMYKNGISHITSASDLDGALAIINYLSFIPDHKLGAIPVLSSGDTWDRKVEWKPTKAAYDPRNFLAGVSEDIEGVPTFKTGILDRDSFFETMGELKNVVDCGLYADIFRWMGSDHCIW
jgi:acetyl-CoA carboxylase/biotin carboxylase 1